MFAGPQSDWRGPTSAPKPEPGKHIAYLSSNQQNDASREWGTAIAKIGEKIGWQVTIIDGHGSPVGWQEGLNQAIALKVDGVVMDADAASLQPQIKDANAQGHRRGRHPRHGLPGAAARPRPVRQHPAGPARHRPRPGRLDHRPFQGQRAGRRHEPLRIRDRLRQGARDRGADQGMPGLRGAGVLELADRRGRAAPAGAGDRLGAEIRHAALHHLGRRLHRRLPDPGAARRRRRAPTTSSSSRPTATSRPTSASAPAASTSS